MLRGHDKVLTSASKRPQLRPFSLKNLKTPCAPAIFYQVNWDVSNNFGDKNSIITHNYPKYTHPMQFCIIFAHPVVIWPRHFLLNRPWKIWILGSCSAVSAVLRLVLWAFIVPVDGWLSPKKWNENSQGLRRYSHFRAFLKIAQNGLQQRPFWGWGQNSVMTLYPTYDSNFTPNSSSAVSATENLEAKFKVLRFWVRTLYNT